MNKVDLQRGMEWAFARVLYSAKELRGSGFVPPLAPATDAAIKDWIRNDAGAYAVLRSLVAQATRLVDGWVDGKETCEDCGQMMERSYPLGLPEGAYVLVCRGCGTNLNQVVNPDYTPEEGARIAGTYLTDLYPDGIEFDFLADTVARAHAPASTTAPSADETPVYKPTVPREEKS